MAIVEITPAPAVSEYVFPKAEILVYPEPGEQHPTLPFLPVGGRFVAQDGKVWRITFAEQVQHQAADRQLGGCSYSWRYIAQRAMPVDITSTEVREIPSG